MARKSQKNSFGWSAQSLLAQSLAKLKAETQGRHAEVLIHLQKTSVPPKKWGVTFAESEGLVRVAEGPKGPYVLLSPRAVVETETETRLQASLNTRVRDAMGALISALERLDVVSVTIDLDLPARQLPAALTGLELALYRFKRVFKSERPKFTLNITHKGQAISEKALNSGLILGQAANLARHLVNLPPNWLNPTTYSEFLRAIFAESPNTQIDIWDEARLKKENMGLHRAVGQGSDTPPCLVHIRYRPPGTAKKAPVAFVGKGITFDSGGLDLKTSSGMRLMKKDMGGSAAVAGLAWWVAHSSWRQPADFYLALAENAVDGKSFRPSDVITARNGLQVEIHNTDAEGRLVLADALDVAITAKDKPRTVIDVATLTGAIKTALGANVAGLFANDARLVKQLEAAATEAGDPLWHMPLVQKYKSSFSTPFADLVNATDGFGGAITAALFLERFVGDVPWAHLDIYAWKDSAEGACLESGGSGQAVFTLAEWCAGLG